MPLPTQLSHCGRWPSHLLFRFRQPTQAPQKIFFVFLFAAPFHPLRVVFSFGPKPMCGRILPVSILAVFEIKADWSRSENDGVHGNVTY